MSGILIPQIVFVGEEAEFLYPLSKVAEYDAVKVHSNKFDLSLMKQTDDITIVDFTIKKKSNDFFISIKFIPWKVGELSFPSFEEFGIYSALSTVKISSVIEELNIETIQPSRPPLLIPGTTYFIYGYTFVFLLIGLIALTIIIAIKKHFAFLPIFFLKKKRVRHFNKALNKLEKSKGNLSDDCVWLKVFEFALREYIFEVVSNSKNLEMFNSYTYSEILSAVKNFFPSDSKVIDCTKNIFSKLEYYRFGKYNFEADSFNTKKKKLVSMAREFMDIAEAEFEKNMSVKNTVSQARKKND